MFQIKEIAFGQSNLFVTSKWLKLLKCAIAILATTLMDRDFEYNHWDAAQLWAQQIQFVFFFFSVLFCYFLFCFVKSVNELRLMLHPISTTIFFHMLYNCFCSYSLIITKNKKRNTKKKTSIFRLNNLKTSKNWSEWREIEMPTMNNMKNGLWLAIHPKSQHNIYSFVVYYHCHELFKKKNLSWC